MSLEDSISIFQRIRNQGADRIQRKGAIDTSNFASFIGKVKKAILMKTQKTGTWQFRFRIHVAGKFVHEKYLTQNLQYLSGYSFNFMEM